MKRVSRYQHRLLARLFTRFPVLGRGWSALLPAVESHGIPWTPMRKTLRQSKLALVTTAGVHHRDQPTFDMQDPDGDPSFRVIDAGRPPTELEITHDYYDHRDANRDPNIVFPIERLKELEAGGRIGEAAKFHFAFMGHILGRHIRTLVEVTAPEAARRLREDNVDAVLLTPG